MSFQVNSDQFLLSFDNFSLLTIWRICTIALVFLLSLECIFYKVLKWKQYDAEILKKILIAIEHGNATEASELVRKHPNYVNLSEDRYGYTPFLLACYYGNSQLVKQMRRCADVDLKRKTKRGESAFYLAVVNFINEPFRVDASCIRELYYAGCDTNEPNNYGFSPIHVAAYFGHQTLIKWLLNKGVDKAVDPSPLHLASSQGHFIAAALLSDGSFSTSRRMIE